jgi:hypothetical protein
MLVALKQLQGASLSEDALVAAAIAQARAEVGTAAEEEPEDEGEFLAIGQVLVCSTDRSAKAGAPIACM